MGPVDSNALKGNMKGEELPFSVMVDPCLAIQCRLSWTELEEWNEEDHPPKGPHWGCKLDFVRRPTAKFAGI